MIPMVDVIIATNFDDWEALYIDGVVVYQHHHVTNRDLGEALVGKAVKSFEVVEIVPYDLWETGEYPEKFEDIPEEKKA
jgi:hypothetical protein